MRLFVLDRGWVLVGKVVAEDWLTCTLDRCATVRRWGTSKGLGELAAKGPLPETVLDPEPDGVMVYKLKIQRAIPCDEKAWAKYGK